MRGSPDILAICAVAAFSVALFVAVLTPIRAPMRDAPVRDAPVRDLPDTLSNPDAHWQRWLRLDLGERQALVQDHAALCRSEDGLHLLELGRQFAELPAPRQACLRRLQQALTQLQLELSERDRHELRSYDARTRAVVLHDWLLRGQPERLASLRAQLGPVPSKAGRAPGSVSLPGGAGRG